MKTCMGNSEPIRNHKKLFDAPGHMFLECDIIGFAVPREKDLSFLDRSEAQKDFTKIRKSKKLIL